MPYKSTKALPSGTAKLPAKAKRAYMGAANSMLAKYKGDDADERAAKAGWAAAKQVAKKQGDKWVLKKK